MSDAPPLLWVFAGPNGAGKTTLFNDMLRGDVPYINADEIARDLAPASGGIDVLRAGREAVRRRNSMLRGRESLSMETTLAGNSALAFMRAAKAVKYHISLAYIGLDSLELSRARIDDRVADGGHDVPHEVVMRRYPDSMNRLCDAMAIADSTMVFDNSMLDRRLLLLVEKGVSKFIANDRPVWFDKAVPERFRRLRPSATIAHVRSVSPIE